MSRCITTLPLPYSLLTRFLELGYTFCEDVHSSSQGSPSSQNAKCDNVDKQFRERSFYDYWVDNGTAYKLLKQWNSDPCETWKTLVSPPVSSNALAILQKECHLGIATFSKALDEYLSGGVRLHALTELSGAPGSGKTQLCLQLCVNVQIPSSFHGLDGQAVYVDTDRGFSISRLSEIAEGCINRCQKIASNSGKSSMVSSMKTFSVSSIMKNIFYMYCPKYADLMAVTVYLKKLLQDNKRIRLIVIDSVTFAFHDGSSSSLQKIQDMYMLLGNLHGLASTHNLAVVVTNHLTTKLEPGKESTLVPALGDSFGHCVNLRLMLGHVNHDQFVCVPIKNVHKAPSSVLFKISRSGISDT